MASRDLNKGLETMNRLPWQTGPEPHGESEAEYIVLDADGEAVADCGILTGEPRWEQAGAVRAEFVVHSVNALVEALAWYYDDIYDGPDCRVPQWVAESVDALGDFLAPHGTLIEKFEEAHWLINRTRKEGLVW